MHLFAKNITYLKNHKNIDIVKIAARLGAAFPYLASGQVQPTVQDLLALSDFFNISIDDLLKKDLALHAELMARVDIKPVMKLKNLMPKTDGVLSIPLQQAYLWHY